jgi:hypothetical protein
VGVSRHISPGEAYCRLAPQALLARLDVECRQTPTGTLYQQSSDRRRGSVVPLSAMRGRRNHAMARRSPAFQAAVGGLV